MKRYSILHIPYMSFFSGELYQDVCLNWRGINLLYLFLLLAICWIPTTIMINQSFNHFVETEAPAVVDQIPEITIQDGKASIAAEEPYYIYIPDTNIPMAILDTTGETTSLNGTDARILITEHHMIVQKSAYETRNFTFSELGTAEFVVNQEIIHDWLETGRKLISIVVYPFGLTFSFIYRTIQVLIYAAIGTLFASRCHSVRSYASLLRLAVVAITPPILISTFLGLAGLSMPFPTIAYMGITMIYLYYGIRVSADAEQRQDQTEENSDPSFTDDKSF